LKDKIKFIQISSKNPFNNTFDTRHPDQQINVIPLHSQNAQKELSTIGKVNKIKTFFENKLKQTVKILKDNVS
jgi:hypothetical protein